MPGAKRIVSSLICLIGFAFLAGCGAARGPSLDPDDIALLRLEYLERAAQLPTLNLDRIELPDQQHLSSFSSMVWRVRSDMAPGRELFRPLPVANVDLLLHDRLVRKLEEYGFNIRGWQRSPELRLRVDVEKLILSSEDVPQGRRACEISLLFRIEELPAGLEIRRFRGRASLELPGSWTVVRGEETIWLPREDGPDPIALAASVAAERFLQESLEFWKTPQLWQEGGVRFFAASPQAGPSRQAAH
jgi:hypothetical protein